MKGYIYLLIILTLCHNLTWAEAKRELVLAIDRSGVEVVISKIRSEKQNKFEQYVVKIEANKAIADLSNTNAFILEAPNRFVLDIPGKDSFKEESIFLADNYMALLRFGKHSDKRRLVIDIESANIFNLDKHVNSKSSISYKLVLSTGNIAPLKGELLSSSEVFTAREGNIDIDIPSAKELESYLSPQSKRYVKEIIAKRNLEDIEKNISNESMLKDVEKNVVNELSEIEREKNSSHLIFYLLVTSLLSLIFFHKSRTKSQKRKYFKSLKELRAYNFNTIIKNQKRAPNFKKASINSLGKTATNPNRKNEDYEKPIKDRKNDNKNIYLS